MAGIGPGMGDRSLQVSPDAESSTLVAKSADSGDDVLTPSSGFLRTILVVLVSLLLCNVFLFSRLWALEQSLHISRSGYQGGPLSDYRLAFIFDAGFLSL